MGAKMLFQVKRKKMLHFIVMTEVNVFFSETEKCGTDIRVYEFSFAQGRVCVCVYV